MAQRAPFWGSVPATSVPLRFEGDSLFVVNWADGRWRVNHPAHHQTIRRLHDMVERAWALGCRPLTMGHDLYNHVFRDWNGEADKLVHRARNGDPFSFSEIISDPSRGLRGNWDGGRDRNQASYGWWLGEGWLRQWRCVAYGCDNLGDSTVTAA